MVERKSGAILNVASTAAFQPGPKMAVYFATKAFVLSFTEALHEELKPHGVKVSCLCPGPTRTEFGEVAGFGGNGMFDRVAMDAPDVVEAGLDGAGQESRRWWFPGWSTRCGAASTRFAPRSVVRKIAGCDQILTRKLNPRGRRRRYVSGMRARVEEQTCLKPTRSTA